MRIRPATITDLDRCVKLNAGSSTDSVWQIEQTMGLDHMALDMRRVRLPRAMELPYPRSLSDLREDWQRKECFLVADEFASLLGFLDLTVLHWQWSGTIEHLVVDREQRRKGVATSLLEAAETWARGSGLRRITAVVQPKNDPAIRLLTRRGYGFAGTLDRYYGNDALSLVYALDLARGALSRPGS